MNKREYKTNWISTPRGKNWICNAFLKAEQHMERQKGNYITYDNIIDLKILLNTTYDVSEFINLI